jgi:hypothetical protein
LGFFKEVEKHAFILAIVGLNSKIMRSGRLASSFDSRMGSEPPGTMTKTLRARAELTRNAQEATRVARPTCAAKLRPSRKKRSAKRDEQRRRDKEEHMQSFANIQRTTLEIHQRKLDLAGVKERVRARAQSKGVRGHLACRGEQDHNGRLECLGPGKKGMV